MKVYIFFILFLIYLELVIVIIFLAKINHKLKIDK